MDDLVPLPGTPLGQAVDAAKGFIALAKAANTVRAYLSDWRDFGGWCVEVGARALPADPATVAAYCGAIAKDGLAASTISRRLTAIGERHKIAGADNPTSHPLVKATLAGIARSIGAASNKKAALTAELLARILRKIPEDDLEGLRDRALILTGFAAALRRSELVDLNVNDIARHPKGLVITIRKSKTDQEGRGLLKAIPHGRKLRVVEAIDSWLIASRIVEGAVFRSFDQGQLSTRRLSEGQVARVIKKRVAAIGLDARLFAGHSLRSGYITTAADHGAALASIAKHAGHAKIDTTMGYVQVADAFKDHSGNGFL